MTRATTRDWAPVSPCALSSSELTCAAGAGGPVVLDAGGEELTHAVGHGPDLVVAETSSADPGLGAALIRLGAGSAELPSLMEVADGWWELAERERQPQRKSQRLAARPQAERLRAGPRLAGQW